MKAFILKLIKIHGWVDDRKKMNKKRLPMSSDT